MKTRKNNTTMSVIINVVLFMVFFLCSFIYLNAIKGLSVMPTIHIDYLNVMMDHFLGHGKNDSTEHRLRYGEALMQTVHLSGPTFSRYEAFVSPRILTMLHTEEDQALLLSGVSILASIAEKAPLTLIPYLTELVHHSVYLLTFQTHVPMVRRSMAYLLTQLFKGLHTDVLPILSTHLSSIYSALKISVESDPDEIVRYHAQQSLNELDRIMRTLLTL
jgi:hypothetical protein